MIITNKHGLPQALVDVVASRDYTPRPGHYTVTTLLKGVREIFLTRRHYHEIEIDVSDMIWSIFGTAVHNIFAGKENPDYLKEERLHLPVGDYVLSGQFDEYHIEGMELNDFKVTSVWKVKMGDFDDWLKQQLMYAYLLMRHSIPTTNGKVTAILRDWRYGEHLRMKHEGYPARQVYVKKFALKEQDIHDIEGFIEAKFAEIDYYKDTPDNDLPICTPEERWYHGEKYAVMGNKRKSAFRLLDNYDDAEAWIEENGKGDYIQRRPGTSIKCERYCDAKKFCNYYLTEVAEPEDLEEAIPF